MTPTISKPMDKIVHCEHCLAANRETDTDCHYCGYSLTPWANRPKPRTIGEEMTFHRFNGIRK